MIQGTIYNAHNHDCWDADAEIPPVAGRVGNE